MLYYGKQAPKVPLTVGLICKGKVIGNEEDHVARTLLSGLRAALFFPSKDFVPHFVPGFHRRPCRRAPLWHYH